MLDALSEHLDILEDVLWTYCGIPLVIGLGLYLSIKSKFFQIRHFPKVFQTFFKFLFRPSTEDPKGGVHPLKAFFAAVGGCVGIGNIVGICTAVQWGGPGALFWIWMTALLGMVIKYAEIYLGFRYRVSNPKGGYHGGPMYFLKRAFKQNWIPNLVCVLLCIYGVEVFQFSVVSTSISTNFGVNFYLVAVVLLLLVIFAGSGGVRRVGNISSKILPLFVIVYISMGSWVLANHIATIPEVLKQIFISAFTGHAALGGFAGASLISAMSHGMRRGCYTSDIGIGYASIIHSESSEQIPQKQASLAIFDIFLDTFVICTTSLFLILVTGLWKEPVEAGMLVQMALGDYFPHMNFFMPLFLFLLGYNTMNAYFCAGLKCAQHLSPRWGRAVYYVFAVGALLVFSFLGTREAQAMMALVGVSLLIINGCGIFLLRHEVSFDLASATPHTSELTSSSLIPEPSIK